MMLPLSVIIVGCGKIAGRPLEDGRVLPSAHARILEQQSALRLVACVDSDPVALAAFSRRWRVPSAYRSLDDAFHANPAGFDLVCITSSTSTHGTILEQCVERPVRGVLCEKPLALGSGDMAKICSLMDRLEDQGRGLWINYTRDWDTALAALSGEIASGAWGRFLAVTGRYNKGLGNNGGHLLGLITQVLQIAPALLVPIFAQVARMDFSTDDPSIDAVLRAPDNCLVHLISTDATSYHHFEIDFFLEKGIVSVEDSGYRIVTRSAEDSPRHPGYREVGSRQERSGGLAGAMANAFASIASELTLGAPGVSQARRMVQVEALVTTIRDFAQKKQGK